MKKIALYFLFAFTFSSVFSQSEKYEVNPEFINLDEITAKIGFPDEAKTEKIEGKVLVQVFFDKNGNYIKHIILESPHDILSAACEKEIGSLKLKVKKNETLNKVVVVPFVFKEDGNNTSNNEAKVGENLTIPPVPLNLKEVIMSVGYPELAKSKGIEGKVVIRVLLDKKGSYKNHVVIQSPHDLLIKPCVEAVKSLKFKPSKDENNKKVECWVNIPFSFKLNKEDSEKETGD